MWTFFSCHYIFKCQTAFQQVLGVLSNRVKVVQVLGLKICETSLLHSTDFSGLVPSIGITFPSWMFLHATQLLLFIVLKHTATAAAATTIKRTTERKTIMLPLLRHIVILHNFSKCVRTTVIYQL